MSIIYLDSSALVKRYIAEPGSNIIKETYRKALNGDLKLASSTWNIGEVLGVLDKYLTKGFLTEQDYKLAKLQFIAETIKLIKLRIIKLIPVKTRILIQTWPLIQKHHIYIADALQITSAKTVKTENFYTGDEELNEIANKEGLKTTLLK
ncbi:MAG: type II toxin-antitoxin system VapC family toxin [Candidatus Aenigmatarchaeota archaeon]